MAAKKKSSRAKASRLVSKHLTEMASVKDALIIDGGESRLCTRAEKLANTIWKNALGYDSYDIKTGLEVTFKPSLSYMKILLERMEGKIQDVSATRSSKSIADRIQETTKSKLNKIAEKSQ